MIEEGIVRRLDNLGRIVIPKEMRKLIDVKEKDFVRIIKQNNSIIIKKFARSCMICGSESELSDYKDVCICRKCIQHIGNMMID